MGNKKVDLSVDWMIKRRLTNTETQKLLILARSANMNVIGDDHFYTPCEVYSYLVSLDNRLDLLSKEGHRGCTQYTYQEVLEALVKKIEENSIKSR